MFRIHCPHCDEYRAEEEFHYVGQARIARPQDPDTCSDRAWGEYLYFRSNPRGPHLEMWVHAAGCRKFFEVLRNTRSYEILATGRLGKVDDGRDDSTGESS